MEGLNARLRRLEKIITPPLENMTLEQLKAIAANDDEIAEYLTSRGYPPTLDALTDEQLEAVIRG